MLALTTGVAAFFVVRGSASEEATATGALAVAAQAGAVNLREETVPAPPATGVGRLLAVEAEVAALVQDAEAALEQGDAPRARDLAARATRRSPASAEAWLTLGRALDALGDHAAARLAYQSCKDEATGDRARECGALLDR